MVDLISPVIVLLIVLIVLVRRTSAGVAVIALLAGVLVDQLLSAWILDAIPGQAPDMQVYVNVVVHLILTFTAMVVAIVAVKANRKSVVIPLLTSLLLGFLFVFFGLQIIAPIPYVTTYAENSGLITFLTPYQNPILAASAILAIVSMVADHKKVSSKDK
ncbi:hypothetical protein H6800_01715 [Candidatus Nomurabacteria bacterium]|nr:hypothetical protein [Candidatus Nomurabacteria bacterium]